MKRLSYLLLFVTTSMVAQDLPKLDITLTEFQSYNPAFVGKNGGSATILSRQVFDDFINYEAYYAQANRSFLGEKLGIGVSVFQERTDVVTNNILQLNGSYSLKLQNEMQLIFGLGSQLNTAAIDVPSNVYVEDPEDPLLNAETEMNIDFDFGFDFSFKNLSVGAAAFRISSMGDEESAIPTYLRAHAIYKMPVRAEADDLEFGVLMNQRNNDDSPEIQVFGNYWFLHDLYLGTTFSSSKTIIARLGYVLDNRYHIGANYETLMAQDQSINYYSLGVRLLFNEQYYQRKDRQKFIPIDSRRSF